MSFVRAEKECCFPVLCMLDHFSRVEQYSKKYLYMSHKSNRFLKYYGLEEKFNLKFAMQTVESKNNPSESPHL